MYICAEFSQHAVTSVEDQNIMTQTQWLHVSVVTEALTEQYWGKCEVGKTARHEFIIIMMMIMIIIISAHVWCISSTVTGLNALKGWL